MLLVETKELVMKVKQALLHLCLSTRTEHNKKRHELMIAAMADAGLPGMGMNLHKKIKT